MHKKLLKNVLQKLFIKEKSMVTSDGYENGWSEGQTIKSKEFALLYLIGPIKTIALRQKIKKKGLKENKKFLSKKQLLPSILEQSF